MPDFDSSKPSIARVYDCLLGGKDNFAVDRELASQLIAMSPHAPLTIRENREALIRAAQWAAEGGISQFVDLGCGMPTEPSVQHAVQEIVPGARVAYVDNDPVVINHLTALLRKDDTAMIADEDVDDAGVVLGKVSGLVDLSRPVCLLMGALLHFYEADAARRLAARYISALAPGSYAVFTVFGLGGPNVDKLVKVYSAGAHPVIMHSAEEFASFFGDLDLVPPGVADARVWRPGWETVPEASPRDVWTYAGMARKTG